MEIAMKHLMWKDPETDTWRIVRTLPDEDSEQVLRQFQDGHPMYEYKLEAAK